MIEQQLHSQILRSAVLLLFLSLNVTSASEARRFQYQSANQSLNTQIKPLQSIIKVAEYRYLERKLVKHTSDQSLMSLFFGENSEHDHIQSAEKEKTSNARILMPQMIGGLPTLYAHIKYPVRAKARGIEGVVNVEFTVNELGMVEDISIIEGIGAGCDEEVIRALKRTRFSPAILNGRYVKVRLSQSVLFKLEPLKR